MTWIIGLMAWQMNGRRPSWRRLLLERHESFLNLIVYEWTFVDIAHIKLMELFHIIDFQENNKAFLRFR